MNKIILVEFNELCPPLLAKWMAAGDLPNFKRLYEKSDIFTTLADESEPANLEPWIQWYSVHTGLPYSEHKVFHLADGPRAGHPDIWSLLHDAGKTVWNCSSMNARQFSYPGSAYLPDPWCTSETPFPAELGVFHKFVGHQVREYSNKMQKLGLADIANFAYFMARNGLRFSTATAIAKQILSEVFSSGKTRWKRVALQDRLLFDVFGAYFKKFSPDFSTFFANSTAHLQHSHWRHMEPEKFTVKPTAADLGLYKDAIRFGYMEMDRLLGDILRLAKVNAHTKIIFATALSQQPYLKYEHVGGHNFYRPVDVSRLFEMLGITKPEIQPVMTHQFLVKFKNAEEAENAQKQLESVVIDEKPVFGFDKSEANSLYFGCQIRTVLQPNASIKSIVNSDFQGNFFEFFYKIEGLKSGRHHPDGCLWIESEKQQIHTDKVSILDILPTIGKLLNVPMKGLRGRELV